MPLTTPESQAVERLGEYNNDRYDASTNPYGLAGEGYKEGSGGVGNGPQAWNDTATAASAVARIAEEVEATEDRISGVVASRLVATSGSTVTIGTGSKTFSVVEDLDTAVPIKVGDWVRAVSTISTNNWMWGTVTAVSTGTPDTLTVDVTLTGGSGTIAGWRIITTGPQGAATGLSSVFDDATPELGGPLDCNGEDLTEVGNITQTTGTAEFNEVVHTISVIIRGEPRDNDVILWGLEDAKTITGYSVETKNGATCSLTLSSSAGALTVSPTSVSGTKQTVDSVNNGTVAAGTALSYETSSRSGFDEEEIMTINLFVEGAI